MDGDSGELVDCVCGILLSGAGQPDRARAFFGGVIEDDPGSHYAGRFWRVFGFVFEGRVEMELRRGIFADDGCGVFCV